MHHYKGGEAPKKVQNNPYAGAGGMQITRMRCIALCTQIVAALEDDSLITTYPTKDTIRKCCVNPCQLDVRFNWENAGQHGDIQDIQDARMCLIQN